MDVCTIIAKNYAAFARVLARSFCERHPGSRCFALVIDEHEGYLDPASEPFELVTVDEIGIERYDRMAALYEVLELSTAVKPWLLKHLLHERGVERLAYLDPDIRVYGDLGEIDAALRDHQLVATPHLTDPMPRDGRKPSESDILIAGAYNLGFIGVSRGAETDHLLDWWAQRLERDCVLDPERGYFVDQRWIDFAPGLVDSFHVLRDPGYNVAYWNLPSRELTESGGSWRVNGRPLRFFHFSGYQADRRDRLSKHQDRIALRPGTPLARICDAYGDELMANGYDEAGGWPYSHAVLPSGLVLDRPMRRVYREATAHGRLERSVFTPDGAREFTDYLNAPGPSGERAGVTRYLHAVWEERAELRSSFPDLDGLGGVDLVTWATTDGSARIPPQLMPAPAGAEGAVAVPRAGVNLAGYFRSVLGVGEVARVVLEALERQNVAVAPVGLLAGQTGQEESEIEERGPSNAPFPINLICVNAEVMDPFVRQMGPDFFAGRHSIGFWWWEVSAFPERYSGAFDRVNEVWVGSHHVADAISAVSPVPVVKVTVPVSVPSFQPASRAELGLPEGYLFGFVFDHNSVFERKNPLAVIDAFEQAFEPGSGASLVLKCINHERHGAAHARLLEAAERHPDVHVIDRNLPRAQKDALMDALDCYVSLHRSEGFGLTLAEAMWLGKPVIGTGYSGNLDFMTAANSYLVDHELVPIGAGADPYPPDGEWAEPDVAHAARVMREVFEDPDAAAERGRRGQAEIRTSHSLDAAGRSMTRRILGIQARWGLRGAGLARERSGAADTMRVARRISRGPEPPGDRELSRPRRAFRDLVLRLVKPYSAFQRNVDEELLNAIEALDRELQTLATGQAQLRPQLQRLLADSQAVPEGAGQFELREHPVAGVVSGYSGAAAVDPGARPAAAHAYDELLSGREPRLELSGADALGPLEQAGDGSLGAVVARGVLERLSQPDLVRFARLSFDKLRPDGILVAETPNPHSPRVLKTFWADPSRERPVFPEVALELCRGTGFESGFVFHPGGSGNVEADRFHEPVYALVATPQQSAEAPGVGVSERLDPLAR